MLASERVQAGIVLLAEGDRQRLRDAIDLAATGWRDLLVAAGLAHADWPARPALAAAGARLSPAGAPPGPPRAGRRAAAA